MTMEGPVPSVVVLRLGKGVTRACSPPKIFRNYFLLHFKDKRPNEPRNAQDDNSLRQSYIVNRK